VKRIIRIGSIGLVIAGAIAGAGEVFAEVPAISLSVNKDGVSRNITIFGTPRTQVPVALLGAGTQVTKSFRANGCGHIVIPNAASYAGLIVAGKGVNVNSAFLASPIAPPTCQGMVSSALPTASHANNALGELHSAWNIGDGKLLLSPGADATAPNGRFVDGSYQDNSAKQRFVTLNACGLGTVSKVSTSTSISVNGGTAVDIGSLTDISPLRCSGAKVVGAEYDHPASFTGNLPDVFKDSQNSIYFKVDSNAAVVVGLASQPAARSVTSDRCGGLTLGSQMRPYTTPFTIGSDTIDPAALSVGLKPNCKKKSDGSYAYDVAPTANITTSAGQVFVKSTTGYPTGFGDRRILSITASASATRNLKANTCGLASIKSKATNPIVSALGFTYKGISYTVNDLPLGAASCVNAGTSASPNYKLYRALN